MSLSWVLPIRFPFVFFSRALDAAIADGETDGGGASRGAGDNHHNDADNALPHPPTLQQKPSFDPVGAVDSDSGGSNAPGRPPFEQQASFDPAGDVGGANGALMAAMTPPAVVDGSPLSMAGGQQPAPMSRPSFDPNRESPIAAGIRAAGGDESRRDVGDTVMSTVEVKGEVHGGVGVGQAGSVSRGTAVARIFGSAQAGRAPDRAPAGGVSRSWEIGDMPSGAPNWNEGRHSADGAVRWESIRGNHAPARAALPATAVTTASNWGMTTPRQQGADNRAHVSLSPPVPSATSSPTPGREPEVFRRPTLGRMASLSWVKEPPPSRRPTM